VPIGGSRRLQALVLALQPFVHIVQSVAARQIGTPLASTPQPPQILPVVAPVLASSQRGAQDVQGALQVTPAAPVGLGPQALEQYIFAAPATAPQVGAGQAVGPVVQPCPSLQRPVDAMMALRSAEHTGVVAARLQSWVCVAQVLLSKHWPIERTSVFALLQLIARLVHGVTGVFIWPDGKHVLAS
jgi:hypothetical protein